MSVAPKDLPASPQQLIEWYRDYVIGLVRRQGVLPQEAEDFADDILLAELQAKNHAGEPVGIMVLYDPSRTYRRGGKDLPVTFRAFLSARVMLRLRGKRETLQRRVGRELLIGHGTVLADMFGGSCDDYSGLDEEEFVRQTRARLAKIPRRSSADACDLVALFDLLVSQVRKEGRVSRAGVRECFDIGETTCTKWMGRLREAVRPAPESAVSQTWEIGGVVLTREDVGQAISILQEARGIMVKQPLASAGHPLSRAVKDWYHPFAREEIAAFPEIEIDPQTHRRPAGHVKAAVLHRLERMLDAPPAVPAEPEEPLSTWDLIEARMWSGGVRDARVMEEIKAMVEEYRREPVSVS